MKFNSCGAFADIRFGECGLVRARASGLRRGEPTALAETVKQDCLGDIELCTVRGP